MAYLSFNNVSDEIPGRGFKRISSYNRFPCNNRLQITRSPCVCVFSLSLQLILLETNIRAFRMKFANVM